MNYIISFIAILVGLNYFVVPQIEHRMTYYPVKELKQTPKSIGIDYENIFLKTPDGKKINGWFMDNPNSDKIILYFHGNAENLSSLLMHIKIFYNLPVDLFIIDYHGYGSSEGAPSEQNFYLDAEESYDFLTKIKTYEPNQVIVYGRSLGGPVAVYLAYKEKTGGVILQSAFTSLKDQALHMLPFYYRPFLFMMKEDFNSIEKIDKINTPLLIIHSKEDKSVPYSMAERLYNKAKEPKQLLLIEKGGHNDWIETKEYIKRLKQFLKCNYSGG